MKKLLCVSVLSLLLAGSAFADMCDDGPMMGGGMQAMGMRSGMGMMGMGMGHDHGLSLMAACFADLKDFDLTPELQKDLEGKRFELQKKAIRVKADLRILRLETSQLLQVRAFDMKAADDKIAEISRKEAELHSAHLRFLHELGAALTDAQWKDLMDRPMDMMPMMDSRHMSPMHRNRMTKPMMDNDEMGHMMDGDSGQMPMMGGQNRMMMRHGPGMGMDPDTGKEAEKFFEEKK